MALAKFDPWQCLRQASGHAYPAYPAYRSAETGNLGMLGVEARSTIGDFEERAAILEFVGGFTREQAVDRAALDVGFASPALLRTTAIEHWRRHLSLAMWRCSARPIVADALAVVTGRWIDVLVALGWDEFSLFGCDPTGRVVVGLVAAIGQRTILAATADSVRFLDMDGRARHHYRFDAATEKACLIWELGNHPDDGEQARTSGLTTISSR